MTLIFGKEIETFSYHISNNFTFHINKEEGYTFITAARKRVIWESLHNHTPFLNSSFGHDQIIPGDGGVFQIIEQVDDVSINTTTSQSIDSITHDAAPSSSLKLTGQLHFTESLDRAPIDYQLTFSEKNEKHLEFDIDITAPSTTDKDNSYRILLVYSSLPNEDFYGFGEQFSYSTLKGQKVPIFVREQGVGRGEEPVTCILNDPAGSVFGEFAGGDSFTTYCAVPQYISTENKALYLKNSEYSSFDLRDPQRVVVRLNATSLQGGLIQASSLLDVISEYTLYSGRMQLLPDWISEGAVVGMQGGSEKVRKVIRDLQRHGTPIAAVWLQDWCGKRLQKTPNGVEFKRLWWNWESDDALYPDWSQFVQQELASQNIRVLAYVNTFLSNVFAKPSFKNNYFLEAQEKEYLVKDPNSKHVHQTLIISSGQNFEAGILDLTNLEAVQWFKSVIKQQIWDAGVSGMMTDFGEYLPYHSTQATLFSAVPTEVYHNLYPQEWAKLHSELIQELHLEHEAVLFYRAAYTRSPGYINLMWAGDQNVAWDQHDGIKSAVTGMVSSGFSGFAMTHSDIGGYTTISAAPLLELKRSKELLYRWMELSAFTAVYRTHEGIIPELNAQFYDDEESLAYYAYFAKLYKSLAPYRKQLIKEANTKGWPLMRHLVLYYPHDPIVRQITYSQYLLGANLLVVPTLSPSVSQVEVYFPKQNGVTWCHIWTNQSYVADGSKHVIKSPLQKPAVFIKEPRQDDGLLDGLLQFVLDQQ